MLSIIGIVFQSFKMSIQNIISNKMRSFLTMLGIIIGVGSVIGLITLVEGATGKLMKSFQSMGSGSLSVSIPGSELKPGLTEDDLDAIASMEEIYGLSPSITFGSSIIYDRNEYDDITVDGKSIVYMQQKKELIKAGRGFKPNEMDGFTYVCMIDEDLAKRAFRGREIMGSKIRLNGFEYTVIGIIGAEENFLFNLLGLDFAGDGTVVVPVKNAMSLSGQKYINSIEIALNDGVDEKAFEEKLSNHLNKTFNNAKKAFSIHSMESMNDAMSEMNGVMSGLLGGIASIALVVGGIGIMNMMLVSVSERTREIGLRKALGAEPGRIQLQFLIESVVLSLTGGAIGIAVGLLIANVAGYFMKTGLAVSNKAIMIGVGFSVGIGILFGWMPAKKASQLNPIDALRSE